MGLYNDRVEQLIQINIQIIKFSLLIKFFKKSMFLHTYLDLNLWFSLFKPNTFTTLSYHNSKFDIYHTKIVGSALLCQISFFFVEK